MKTLIRKGRLPAKKCCCYVTQHAVTLTYSYVRRSLTLSLALFCLAIFAGKPNLHSNNNKIKNNKIHPSPTGLAQNFEKFESIKESSKKNGSNNNFDLNSPEKNKK